MNFARDPTPKGAVGIVLEVLNARAKGCAEVLGLTSSLSKDKAEIKRAAKQRWLLVHPDKTSSPGAALAFQAVKDAEMKLLLKADEASRRTGSSGTSTAAAAAAAAGFTTPSRTQQQRRPPPSVTESDSDDYEEEDQYSDSDDDDPGWDWSWQWGESAYGRRSTWEDIRKERASFSAEIARARAAAWAAARAKQKEYEAALAAGRDPHQARQMLAAAREMDIDYSQEVHKTLAMRQYGLTPRDLQGLKPVKLANPHDPSWSPQLVYKTCELVPLAVKKYGKHWKREVEAKVLRNAANRANRDAKREREERGEEDEGYGTPKKRASKREEGEGTGMALAIVTPKKRAPKREEGEGTGMALAFVTPKKRASKREEGEGSGMTIATPKKRISKRALEQAACRLGWL